MWLVSSNLQVTTNSTGWRRRWRSSTRYRQTSGSWPKAPGPRWWASGSGGASAPASDRKSTRLNSSHLVISYAVFCLKKKTPRESSVVVIRAGPELDAQEVRIPPDLLAKRMRPGEPGRLPLAPGGIRGGPPADARGPLVEWRGRARVPAPPPPPPRPAPPPPPPPPRRRRARRLGRAEAAGQPAPRRPAHAPPAAGPPG